MGEAMGFKKRSHTEAETRVSRGRRSPEQESEVTATEKRSRVRQFIKSGGDVSKSRSSVLRTRSASPSVEEAAPVAIDEEGPLDSEWLKVLSEMRTALNDESETILAAYRSFFDDDNLNVEDVRGHVNTMALAVESPSEFYDIAIGGNKLRTRGIPSAAAQVAKCAWKIPRHYPARKPTASQTQEIEELRDFYKLDRDIAINPNDHKYEFCDPRWWPLILEKLEEKVKLWPLGLKKYLRHSPQKPFVYDAENTSGDVKVALFADFGTGSYHSRHIARQLARWKYPYAFHLGDVYYGGTQSEFDDYYAAPLNDVMDDTVLFSLPENHELYGEGKAYKKFLKTEHQKGRILQEGSYFCLRFPKHQIIGIDVNWNGRKRFEDKRSRKWLDEVLNSGSELTTILLTGSAPYVYGSNDKTKLFDDLKQWREQDSFNLWFWGDNHYCALFDRDPNKAPFVGSCIGHGGYPGGRRKKRRPSYVPTAWLETEPRFPKNKNAKYMRTDVSNNGWCEMTLRSDGGVDLLYVDWLGAKRCLARFDRTSNGMWHYLERSELETEAFEDRKTLHSPPQV